MRRLANAIRARFVPAHPAAGAPIHRAAGVLIAAAALAAPAGAQQAGPDAMLDTLRAPFRQMHLIGPAEQAEWNALGRLDVGGIDTDRTCTGALVAPATVLTASHCARGTTDEVPDDSRRLHFVAGWNRGGFAARSVARRFDRHPGAAPRMDLAHVGKDLALVQLADPVPAVAPLPIGAPPHLGEELAYAGYRNELRHAPAFFAPCPVVEQGPDYIVVGCEPKGGNSGSPVLRRTQTGWEIVAVMVARAPGYGIAAVPGDWLAGAMAAD